MTYGRLDPAPPMPPPNPQTHTDRLMQLVERTARERLYLRQRYPEAMRKYDV